MIRGASRRRMLWGLGVVGLGLGCTSHSDAKPLPREQLPIPAWPDGPAPEVVLTTDSGDTETTWYADGLVLQSRTDGPMMSDDPRWLQLPELHLLRVAADEVTRLRGLVAHGDVQGAAPYYGNGSVHDGGFLFIAAGERRIQLGYHAHKPPEPLAQILTAADAMTTRFAAEGVDAFKAGAPRLVALHRRTMDPGPDDRLMVFANGLLDHRTFRGATADGGDWTDPQIQLAQTPVAELAPLLAALAELDRHAVTSRVTRVGGARQGTAHLLAHAGQTPRIRTAFGQTLEPPLTDVFAALRELRRRVDAPDDVPTTPPPRAAGDP